MSWTLTWLFSYLAVYVAVLTEIFSQYNKLFLFLYVYLVLCVKMLAINYSDVAAVTSTDHTDCMECFQGLSSSLLLEPSPGDGIRIYMEMLWNACKWCPYKFHMKAVTMKFLENSKRWQISVPYKIHAKGGPKIKSSSCGISMGSCPHSFPILCLTLSF